MPVIVKNRRDDPRRRGAAGRGQLGGHLAAARAVRAGVLRGGTPLRWSAVCTARCARAGSTRGASFSTQLYAPQTKISQGPLGPVGLPWKNWDLGLLTRPV